MMDLCGSGKVKVNHISVNSDYADQHTRWHGIWSADDCTVELRAEGDVVFTPNLSDVQSISSGGFFEIHERHGDDRRDLKVTASGNGLQYVFKLNGKEQPMDAAAKSWLSNFLLSFERSTGFSAKSRVPQLLKQGGPSAVLDEISNLQTDYVRGIYFRMLLEQPNLPASVVVRVMD